MKISVNFINQNVVLDVEPSTTVDDLKKIIYEKLRVLTSMQCVVYGAREMSKDSLQLSDYNITSNALITLSLKKHITSSFDRKIQQIPTSQTIIERTESCDQQGDKKESVTPGKLKSATRVHFDDLRTLTESYVERKEDERGSPEVYQTDVRGFISEYDIVNTHEAMKMPTIGTPQKCSVDEFEASPVFQKDIVVNEAYLLQIPYDTITVQRDGHRVDSTREMKVMTKPLITPLLSFGSCPILFIRMMLLLHRKRLVRSCTVNMQRAAFIRHCAVMSLIKCH